MLVLPGIEQRVTRHATRALVICQSGVANDGLEAPLRPAKSINRTAPYELCRVGHGEAVAQTRNRECGCPMKFVVPEGCGSSHALSGPFADRSSPSLTPCLQGALGRSVD